MDTESGQRMTAESTIIRKPRSNVQGFSKWTVTVFSLTMIFTYYMYWAIYRERGVDFFTRLSEAKYFWHGINPYDIFTGARPGIEGYGSPDVYYFVSYIVLGPFVFLDHAPLTALVLVIADILSVALVMVILGRLHEDAPTAFALASIPLGSSYFFLLHVSTLNYNIVASMALLGALWALFERRQALFIVFGFLLGVKPSIFLPFVVYVALIGQWRQVIQLGAVFAISLLFVWAQTGTDPLVYASQLANTAEDWSNLGNSGLLAGFFTLGIEPSVGLSAGLSTIFLLFASRWIGTGVMSAYSLVVFASLAFFYNHVHAWSLAFPILVHAFAEWRRGERSIAPAILLVAFLVVPRFLSQYPECCQDGSVVLHNVLRIGVMAVALALLFRKDAGLSPKLDSDGVALR
jgi:hypothetical protein